VLGSAESGQVREGGLQTWIEGGVDREEPIVDSCHLGPGRVNRRDAGHPLGNPFARRVDSVDPDPEDALLTDSEPC